MLPLKHWKLVHRFKRSEGQIYYVYIGTIKPAFSLTTGVRQDNSATLPLSYLSNDTLKKETNRLMNHKMIPTAEDDEIHDSGY